MNRELTLTLDDTLLEDGRIAPFNTPYPAHTAMGRFGNVLLVNGNPNLALQVKRGELVRFFLTNTANSHVFNVTFVGAQMKLVGGDGGRYERESFVDSVLLAPSERAVEEVLFDRAGQVILEHRTPAGSYNLASITIAPDASQSN